MGDASIAVVSATQRQAIEWRAGQIVARALIVEGRTWEKSMGTDLQFALVEKDNGAGPRDAPRARLGQARPELDGLSPKETRRESCSQPNPNRRLRQAIFSPTQ